MKRISHGIGRYVYDLVMVYESPLTKLNIDFGWLPYFAELSVKQAAAKTHLPILFLSFTFLSL